MILTFPGYMLCAVTCLLYYMPFCDIPVTRLILELASSIWPDDHLYWRQSSQLSFDFVENCKCSAIIYVAEDCNLSNDSDPHPRGFIVLPPSGLDGICRPWLVVCEPVGCTPVLCSVNQFNYSLVSQAVFRRSE